MFKFCKHLNNKKDGVSMKRKIERKVAKGTMLILDAFLKIDANSTSCYILYQPKAPRALEKYRRNYDKKMDKHDCELAN